MVSGSRILTGVERDKRGDLADNQVPDAACSDCDGRATAKRLYQLSRGLPRPAAILGVSFGNGGNPNGVASLAPIGHWIEGQL